MSGTDEALTEIFTSSKSTSREVGQLHLGRLDERLGGGPAVAARRAPGARDPALTPMRMGTPRSFASGATGLISASLRRLPGLSRRPWTPASSAASAISWWKWMSATIGTGERGTIVGQPLGGRLLVAGAPDDVGPGRRQRVDLGEGALDIGGLGDRHRLHRDRGVAADRHAADVDLAGLAPRGEEVAREFHLSIVRRSALRALTAARPEVSRTGSAPGG